MARKAYSRSTKGTSLHWLDEDLEILAKLLRGETVTKRKPVDRLRKMGFDSATILTQDTTIYRNGVEVGKKYSRAFHMSLIQREYGYQKVIKLFTENYQRDNDMDEFLEYLNQLIKLISEGVKINCSNCQTEHLVSELESHPDTTTGDDGITTGFCYYCGHPIWV